MDRLNYHHLYLFWNLAKEGTFTKTAMKLSIAQSAVTFQIKSLEAFLGVILVDRGNRRKPILTEDGKAVLEYAEAIFESGEELLKWSKHGIQNKNQVLRIGALSGLSRNLQFEFLKPILSLKDVRVEVTTGDQEKLVRLLKEHHLDLILSSHNVPADGRVVLYSNVLTTSPIIFVVGKGQKVRGAELKDYLGKKSLCLPSRNFEVRPEIDAYLSRIKTPKIILGEIDDIALLRIFAIKSEAVVAIPEMGVLSEIESGDVQIIARPKGLEQKFYVISRQRRSRNPIAEMLIEKMRGI
jgi:LysR family transcriptional activator of nhaA